jgi:nucleotide-binding universal stress UspA family protein
MKHMLVAVDGSEPSSRAVDLAADLAAKYAARLTLLTVVGDMERLDSGFETYAKVEHIKDSPLVLQIEGVRNALQGLRDRACTKGARDVGVEVAFGDAAEQILSYAKGGEADMIVMGNRGHGRLVGLLLGSVAQKVVGLAACPVLVAH